MESMGKKPRRRRSFTPEFKAEIVQLCQQGDRSAGQVAMDFDLTEIAVREWVKQADTRHHLPVSSSPSRCGPARLDGMLLAITMVAGRHSSLAATVKWSCRLLDDHKRRVLGWYR